MTVKLKKRKHHRRYQRQRLRILRNASCAFSSKGFGSVTMEEIGESLEMTKGSLYYYFSSKLDLLYFCQEYSLERLHEEARAIVDSDLPVPEQLHKLIQSQVCCLLDELGGSAAHLQFRELPSEQLSKIIDKRNRYEKLLRQLVERGIQTGNLDCDPRLAVWLILGAVNWTVQWYRKGGELSPVQIGEAFADMLLRSISTHGDTQAHPAHESKIKKNSVERGN